MTHTLLTALITPFMTLTLLASAVLGNPSADEASVENVVQISTKESSAGQLIFLRHDGPYFRLASTIETLTSYMTQHQQVGPILIRYEGHPQSKQFSSHMRVGFRASNHHEPTSPCELVQESTALVVYATITAGSLSPSRSYAHLSDWAAQHELDVVGSFTEIYAYPRTVESSELATVEVQLGVRKKNPQPSLETKPVSNLSELASETFPETKPNPVEIVIKAPEKTITNTPVVANEVVQKVSEQVEPIPVTTIAPPTKSMIVQQPPALKKSVSPLVIEVPATEQPAPQTSEVATSFEPIVDLLFAKFSRSDNTTNAPLAKLTSRIHAIAQGVDQRYPGQASPLKQLAKLMKSRLANLQLQPAKVHQPNQQLKLAIKKLDVVMVGIGYRTITSSQALVRVLTILREAVEVSTNAPNSLLAAPETP